MRIILTILIISCMLSAEIIGQKVISGSIVNKENNPLIGVNVIEKGTENGTITAIDGTFTLEVSTDTIVISYTGFKTKEIATQENSTFQNVVLEQTYQLYSPEYPIEINAKHILSEKINITTLPSNITSTTTPGNTADILNTIPGIHMQSGGFNTNKVTIRGVGSTSQFATSDMKIFYNNIPLHNSIGQSAIEDIGLHMAEKIKVIRGTTGSEYESGYGGALILENKNIRLEEKTTLLSNNTIGRWGHFITQNQLNIGRTNKINTHNLSIYHSLTTDEGYRDNNQFDKNNITVNYTMNKGGKIKLTGLLNRVDLKAFIPSSLDSANYYSAPTQAAFTWNNAKGNEKYNKTLVGINLDYTPNSKISMSNTIYGRLFESSELRPFNTIDEYAKDFGVKGHLQYSRATYEELYTVGYRIQHEDYEFQLFDTDIDTKGAQFSQGIENRYTYELYGKIEAEINNKWSYKLGLNSQYAHITADNQQVLNKAFLLPEATFTYRLSDYLRIYTNGGRGINYFSPEQALLPNGLYSEDLRPTAAWNISIGSKGTINGNLQYRTEIYHMWATDLIVADRDPSDQPINTNAGSASYAGIEIELKYNLITALTGLNNELYGNAIMVKKNRSSPLLYLDIQCNIMKNRYQDYINNQEDYSNNTIPGSPTQSISSSLSYEQLGLFAFLRYQFANAYNMRDDNTIKSESYQVLNAAVGYKWNIGSWQIIPRIDIANFLDEKYTSMTLVNASSFGGNQPRYYYPGKPRHSYLSLQIKYSI